jgi:hypothetical protein
MSKVEVYRRHAQACVEMAERMSPQDAASLLKIAEAWLKLAEEAIDAPSPLWTHSPSTDTRQ